MCLYIKMIKNPKYRINKKNKGNIPLIVDERLSMIPAKCGKCFECRQEKRRNWRIRITEEFKQGKAEFITLTFDNENLKELSKEFKLPLKGNENTIVTKAFRRFLERWRKENGKSFKHWFITELGEDNGRIHLHGFIFGNENVNRILEKWKYGFQYKGTFCNEKTANYVTKYMLKENKNNPTYTQIILCSKGIGKGYVTEEQTKRIKKLVELKKDLNYIYRNGEKSSLPKYYKDKMLEDKEKEKNFINILDKGYVYVGGEKVNITDEETIKNLESYYRELNIKVHGDNEELWKEAKRKRQDEKRQRIIAEAKKYR